MNRFREQSVSAALFCFRLHIAHLQLQIRCRCKIAVLQEVKIAAVSARAPLLFFLTLFSVFLFFHPSTHCITMFGIIIHLGYISQHIWYHTFPYYHSHHFLRYIWYFISQTSHFSALWYLYKQGKTVFGTMLRLLRFIYIFELLPS